MTDFPLTKKTLDEIVENLDSLNIGRDLDNPEWVYELIGKALYNGYEIHRTQDKIEIVAEKGPVIEEVEEEYCDKQADISELDFWECLGCGFKLDADQFKEKPCCPRRFDSIMQGVKQDD